MKRRVFVASLVAMAAMPRTGTAQGAARVIRVGWLTAQQASSLVPYVDAMRIALADLGYVEGRNLVIEFRYGDDVIERVPELAAELARLPVDLIVAQGAAAFEIRGLGLPIPIVYSMSADPVSGGFADSLARPRGNMTGVTLMAVEFNGKRLELLQEIVPELRRVAIVGNPEHPGSHLERAFSEETARRLGLTIEYLPTRARVHHAARRRGWGVAAGGARAAARQGVAHRRVRDDVDAVECCKFRGVSPKLAGPWIHRGAKPHYRVSLSRRRW